jgi:hypothetical protein
MSSRVGLCSDAECGEAAEQGEDGAGDSASLPASSSDDRNCVINSKKIGMLESKFHWFEFV